MNSHLDLNDADLEKQFKNCSLDPSLFSHEAHIRLAWIHIQEYGVEKAIVNLCSQIKSYAKSIGADNKFNLTVTVAAVRAVHHFMQRTNTTGFLQFINENPVLLTDFKGLIASHYKTDIFRSEKARFEFLEPELLPFT